MGSPVVHFEITGPEDDQLPEFYAELFGWQPRPAGPAGYVQVGSGSAGIDGGIGAGDAAFATFCIEADDLQSVLDKVNLLGGKTADPITDLSGMVTFATFTDPGGLLIGLIQAPVARAAAAGDAAAGAGRASPGDTGGMVGSAADGPVPVSFFEIAGPDPDRIQRFYGEVFGWQASAPPGQGPGYRIVDTGSDRGIRGGIAAASQGGWATVYASVPDVAAALDRAAELGATRAHGPVTVGGQVQTGVFRDPAGNLFGVIGQPAGGAGGAGSAARR